MLNIKISPRFETLNIFHLFQDIPEIDRRLLFDHLKFSGYEKGEIIIHHMDSSTDFYLLFAGTLLVHQYSAAGREVSYRQLIAGNYFGELAALDSAPRSVSIMAITPATVGCISAEKFHSVLKASPALCRNLLGDMAARVRDLSGRLFTLTTVTVPFRIDAEILKLAIAAGIQDNQATISPMPNHSEIASLIGAQREAVTREISRLADAGLIIKQPKNIIVKDVCKLIERIENGGGDNLSA